MAPGRSPVRSLAPNEAFDSSERRAQDTPKRPDQFIEEMSSVAPVLPGERAEDAKPTTNVATSPSNRASKAVHKALELGAGTPAPHPPPDLMTLVKPSVLNWFNKRNGDTLRGALAFVPWVLQQAYFEGKLESGSTVMHTGDGAVVFSSASGFTTLTERLARRSNGAELLSHCLKLFFTPLIDLINSYRGDTIKFSCNALTIYFPSVDDTLGSKFNGVVPPHGTYGLPDLGPKATAVLRASACCTEIHRRLHEFDTGIDGVRLCLHIGVGCGEVSILKVGGVVPPEARYNDSVKVPRWEYLIVGTPLEQISIAEPLAKQGETCLSPQAWEYVKDCVIEGRPVEDHPNYHLLLKMDESKYTFPTIKHAAMENDVRMDNKFRLSELHILRQYIPTAVFKQIECGTLGFVNEMRNISTIFVSGSGLNPRSEKGAQTCQELVMAVQQKCYAHEGTMNKFLVDDKGMLFLMVFGLPPLVHTDDPTRAVLACFDMIKVFKRLELVGRFGVTTGNSYCGLCGSPNRMEYTVLGDTVNLCSRLCATARENTVLCDEATRQRSTRELQFTPLEPVKFRGKANKVKIYEPVFVEHVSSVGITAEKKITFPWYAVAGDGVAATTVTPERLMQNTQQLCSVKAWFGIQRISEMLGGPFDANLHRNNHNVAQAAQTAKPPDDSPLARGGVIVIEGATGVGKLELAEHLVMYSTLKFKMVPIFGTMGPRPNDSIRFSNELLRSTLGAFRFVQDLPNDPFQALTKVAPPQFSTRLPLLRLLLSNKAAKEQSAEVLESCIEVVKALVSILCKQISVTMTLQYEWGMTVYPKIQQDRFTFWGVVQNLSSLVGPGPNPAVLVIICREAERSNAAVRIALREKSFLELGGLPDDHIVEYIGAYLGVPVAMVPQALRSFVSKVTLGNPQYIRETIDQLQEHDHLQVLRGQNGVPRDVQCKDVARINISAWQHTAMVGSTICLLESLDPLEAMVLKMSTCFQGPFTLPDLAASQCSRWANATHFDYLRLLKAIRRLQDLEILDAVDPPPPPAPRPEDAAKDAEKKNEEEAKAKVDTSKAKTAPQEPEPEIFGLTKQHYQMRNVLIRAVGASMVLDTQRKSVKRQALIDRALALNLPERMAVVKLRRTALHIPWYYEQALRLPNP